MELFVWRIRTTLFVGHARSLNFVRNADILRSLSASQALTPHLARLYSSSSRRSPPPKQQEQLPFVRAAYISEKDLAHRMFFALDRPLLSLGHEQPQPAWEREQQQQQVWEDEEEEIEDYEEEMSSGGPLGGIPTRAVSSASAGPSTYSHHNHNHKHNNAGAFSQHAPIQQQTSSSSPSLSPPTPIEPTEAQRIVDRLFREVDENLKAERAVWESALDSSIAQSHAEDVVEEREQEEREHRLQENDQGRNKAADKAGGFEEDNTLYTTNIRQKRRLKMNKHKHKKLRKRQRALRKRLGK